MVLLLANVLCEVVLVFTCMFYHVDYYRIIVIVYDYECSQHHASFHVYIYICMRSEFGNPRHHHPPPQRERKWRKGENRGDKKKEKKEKKVKKVKSKVWVQLRFKKKKKKATTHKDPIPPPPPPPKKEKKRKTHPKTIKLNNKKQLKKQNKPQTH